MPARTPGTDRQQPIAKHASSGDTISPSANFAARANGVAPMRWSPIISTCPLRVTRVAAVTCAFGARTRPEQRLDPLPLHQTRPLGLP